MHTFAIDGNTANVSEPVGVSVYTLELLKHFQKQANPNLRFHIFLREAPLSHLPPMTEFFTYHIVWGPRLWLSVFLPLTLWMQRIMYGEYYDVFFAPAHYAPSHLPLRIKIVTTIHDLAYIPYPQEFLAHDLYKLTHWTADAVARSARIIAVSHNTKKDIDRAFHCGEKITVIANGFTPIPPNTGKREPFMLMLGTLQPRKNHLTLIDACIEIRKKYPEMRLVIAGKRGWSYDAIAQKITETEGVEYVGSVTKTQQIALYQDAFCFLLPSLYEGFGIPILEAMSAGCPVITSNTSSLPEVAGDAALLVNPLSVTEIVEAYEKLYTDRSLYRELQKKGLVRASQFSWETCSQNTLATLITLT